MRGEGFEEQILDQMEPLGEQVDMGLFAQREEIGYLAGFFCGEGCGELLE